MGNIAGTMMYKVSKDSKEERLLFVQGGSLPFVVTACFMAICSLLIWRLDEPVHLVSKNIEEYKAVPSDDDLESVHQHTAATTTSTTVVDKKRALVLPPAAASFFTTATTTKTTTNETNNNSFLRGRRFVSTTPTSLLSTDGEVLSLDPSSYREMVRKFKGVETASKAEINKIELARVRREHARWSADTGSSDVQIAALLPRAHRRSIKAARGRYEPAILVGGLPYNL